MAKPKFAPARPKSCVVFGNARFTVLTSSLLRMEYGEGGRFRDEATQVVINRDFETPSFTVTEKNGGIEIRTSELRLT